MSYNTLPARPQEGVSKTAEKQMGAEHLAGLWRHPEAKDKDGKPLEAICIEDPLFGNAQAEAFARQGYERVADVPEDRIVSLPELAADAREVQNADIKGIAARLNALEGASETKDARIAELERQLTEANAGNGSSAPDDSNPALGEGESKSDDGADTYKDYPLNLSKLPNSTVLRKVAEAEGVELTPELDTNKKIAAAIVAKREESEK